MLLSGLFFGILLIDYEIVIRVDFPEGRLETLCVADISQEVGDPLARSQQEWDRRCFTSELRLEELPCACIVWADEEEVVDGFGDSDHAVGAVWGV